MYENKHDRYRVIIILMISIAMGIAIVSIQEAFDIGLSAFISEYYMDILGVFPVLVILIFLVFTVLNDSYIRPDLKRILLDITLVLTGLTAQNYLEYRLAVGQPHWLLRTLLAICGYCLRPLILVLFMQVIAPERSFRGAWILVAVNALTNVTALFSHICFWIDTENHYHGGPLNETCFYISMFLFLCLFVLTMRIFKPRKHKETWIPVLALLLVIMAIVMDYSVGGIKQPVSFLTIAVVISTMAYYNWLHLQYVREHEQAVMAGQRIQLMISQIKPHFLYNSLAVIAELCDMDPALARATTVKFSDYLRGNMNSIDEAKEIRFEQELSHTKIYLEIEQLRFGEALQVCYDITCRDFLIPALTVEPLVENAVRHGVRENPGGRGTVTILTREMPDHYEVTVKDDGPGFDPAEVYEDNKSHVGIKNVRERLMQVCGGSLVIESAPGQGTSATIILYKNKGE